LLLYSSKPSLGISNWPVIFTSSTSFLAPSSPSHQYLHEEISEGDEEDEDAAGDEDKYDDE
jgi:hypothetical protein